MSKLFVDTNIILDWLLDREPYAEAAAELFSLAENKEVTLLTSGVSIVNTEYFLRKAIGSRKARTVLSELRLRCNVTTAGAQQVDSAIHAAQSDFEDAYQTACAVSAGAGAIITRNPKDFKKVSLPVMSASDFIASRHSN